MTSDLKALRELSKAQRRILGDLASGSLAIPYTATIFALERRGFVRTRGGGFIGITDAGRAALKQEEGQEK